MDSKVLKNIFIYGIGDFIVTGVSAFLLIPLYTHYLSTKDYAIYNILNNNTTIFTYIFQFGIISAFARIYFLRKNENEKDNYISSIILLHFIYSLFLFVVIFIFKQLIFAEISPLVSDKRLLFFPVAMSFLTFLPAFYYVYLRMNQKVDIFLRFQLLTIVLLITIIGLILLLYKFNLITLIFSVIFTNLIIWLLIFFLLFKKLSVNLNVNDIKETLKFSLPIFIGYISYFMISRYNMIILQKHISLKDIGLFSLAQQISMIPTLASIAIAKALQPLLFASKTDGELKGKVDQWDNIYKIFLIWMVGCMIFSIDILINLFLPTIYIGSIKIAQYMIFVNLIYNFALIENSILLYKMKSKLLSIITIAGAIINVLMSNWLVINYKINGVILAMLISFILTFTLEAYFSKKHIGFNYNILQLVISIGIILGFLILSSIELINKHYVFIIIYKIIGFLILSGLLYKSIQKVKLSHNRLS